MAAMTRFLHTMVRVTDPPKSRAFYEALGFSFNREMDIVRNGEKEATNYFFSLPGSDNVLELTYNHDGRTYDLGTGYGPIAVGVEPERPPYTVSEGGSRLCFVRDPDGYRLELIDRPGS
jgi:lactoylglutathione lyase